MSWGRGVGDTHRCAPVRDHGPTLLSLPCARCLCYYSTNFGVHYRVLLSLHGWRIEESVGCTECHCVEDVVIARLEVIVAVLLEVVVRRRYE